MKQLSHTERSLAEGIDQAAMLKTTCEWTAINSGTTNLPGLAAQADALADAFACLPGELSLRDAAPVTAVDAAGEEIALEHGRHLVLRVRPDAERRFLLTGHMDTVFPADHPFQSGSWIDDDTYNAPGSADMKGGIAVILHALMAIESAGGTDAIGYDVLINADEETGSLSSSALIAELAAGKFAALTYEPSALPDGTLAHARGGSGNYSLIVSGRSAHAGRNPEDGRNALVAAAALAVELKAMGHADLSVNPARIDGGSANNVVPDRAVLRFNIRPKTVAAADAFEEALASLIERVATGHEVTIGRAGGITRPPKPVDARAQALFDLVAASSEALGRPLAWQSSGGVCDGNNIAACGVPVVDTMGVRGGAIHSPREFMIASSLAERAALSAVVLHRLASGDHF